MIWRSPYPRHFLLARPRRGMTLLELILALALSAVLLVIMGAALRSGIETSISGRGDVEQMRVVQGVIALVTDDIKGAAIVETLDTSGAMQLAKDAAGFNVDSIDTETLGSLGAGMGAGSGSGFPAGGGADSSGVLSNRRPMGVFGGLNFLEIDVLREKPQLLLDDQGMVVATAGQGGIYTVRYSLGEGVATLGTPHSTIQNRDNFGLIRQEVNRDLYHWAEQTGGIDDVAGDPLLVAAEVEQIEFRYYDGFQYHETWEPELQGAWPVAIEVRMWFTHHDQAGEVARHHEERPYVMTIALPTAWNLIDLMMPTESGIEAMTGSTNSGGTGGTP